MKFNAYLTIAAALVLTTLATSAQASVIDLGERELATPLMGIDGAAAYIEMDQGLASGFLTYLNKCDPDDGFSNDGAVDGSHFGGTFIDNETNATVSWDMTGTGFGMNYVFLKDGRESQGGPYLYHLYGVTPDETFNSMGDQLVTINGIKRISYVAFFGSKAVPEGGATLILLGLALGATEMTRRLLRRNANA